MPQLRTVQASPDAEACRLALTDAMRPYADKLGPEGMLAVASVLVGQLVALQDQRSMTAAMAMQLVAQNIEVGNREAVAKMNNPIGRA